MIQVEKELVVQPLDVLHRRDDGLEVLVLSPSVNGVVDHDTVYGVVVVSLG